MLSKAVFAWCHTTHLVSVWQGEGGVGVGVGGRDLVLKM